MLRPKRTFCIVEGAVTSTECPEGCLFMGDSASYPREEPVCAVVGSLRGLSYLHVGGLGQRGAAETLLVALVQSHERIQNRR